MMPWFPQDFLGATSGWTFGERALYRSLLESQWIVGYLPSDETRLLRIAGMASPEEIALFEASWPTVREKFEPIGRGRIANKRLEEHRVKSQRLHDQRVSASQASAATRRERALDRSDTDRTTARSPSREHLSPSKIEEEEKKTPPSGGSKERPEDASPAAPLPDDLDDDVKSENLAKPASREPNGTRIPDDFDLTPQRRGIALSEHLDPDRTFASFRDYWTAAAGQRARKRDWDATWRTWCRTEADRRKRPVNAAPQQKRKTLFDQYFPPEDDDAQETQPAA